MIWLLLRPLPPHSRQHIVSLSQSSCVSPVELTDGRRGGVHSILFGEISLFSGGGDEMVQICRSFRYTSAKKSVENKFYADNYFKKIITIVGVVGILLRAPE
jgi:hypothetical protein